MSLKLQTTASKATLSFMQNLSKIKLATKNRAQVLSILQDFDNFHINEPHRNMPLDLWLRFHFLKNKKEFDNQARSQIVEYVYTLQRYKGYLNAIASRKQSGRETDITWSSRLKAF